DIDTLLPRLSSVSMLGLQGTPEENVALPIANYAYGSATTSAPGDGHPVLHYERVQAIDLPTGINLQQISGTDYDPSVTAPGQGSHYATWQSLTDVTGDGRPDLVFKKNNQLWVAYNAPGPDGTTTIGTGPQGIAQLFDTTFSSGPFSTQTSVQRRFAYA